MRAATGSEPVRKAFEVGLVNLVEDRHHSLLDDLVLQCCDAQGALPPIGLRYVDSSRRLCPVRSTMPSTVQIVTSIFHSVPFPPQPPRKLALLCSTGSLVLRHSPTSPARSRPPFGLWPLRTGLVLSSKTYRRSPGSRACCFSACAGSQTTQDRTATRE